MTAVRLNHRIEGTDGDERWLVLANSLGTSTGMWDAAVEALRTGAAATDGLWILRYDHRGHGGSPVPPGPYTLDELGEDVLALLDELSIARVTFCGVSLGGMVGMWIAARAPERVERLIVCCSSPHMPPVSMWEERANAVREAGSVAAIADTVVERWLTPEFAQQHPEARERLRQMLVDTPAEGYAGSCEAIGAMDLRPMLGEIRAPTLVIGAAQDLSTPPDVHAQAIAGAIEQAELVVVEDAAHIAPVQQPQRIAELIRARL